MKYLAFLLALSCAFAAIGCDPPPPDPKESETALAQAQDFRKIYDSVNGNWDRMNASDKEKVIKIFNNKEEDAKKAWAFAGQGGEGGSRTSAPK